MRDHFKDLWPAYVILSLMLTGMFLAVHFGAEEQRRINYCFDRGMVLVDTPAGKRCAAIHSLEPVR